VDSKRVAKYGDNKDWLQKEEPAYTLDVEGNIAVMTLRTFSNTEIKKFNKVKSKKVEMRNLLLSYFHSSTIKNFNFIKMFTFRKEKFQMGNYTMIKFSF